MTEDAKINFVATAKRRARIFRIVGLSVLILGLAGAGLVYWLGTRAANMADDLSMTGFDRATTRQMGILYGQQGELADDWLNDLKQPRTQAILLASASALATFVCFKFARWSDRDAEAT